MKLFKHLKEDTRYSIWIILVILAIPAVFFIIDRLLNLSPEPIISAKQEKTVIVKESSAPAVPQKIPPKEVFATVRDAIRQGNYSTAYMEISKAPKDSPEYEELQKIVAEESKKRKRPGVQKQKDQGQDTLRYIDEAAPRDRGKDWLFVYFNEFAGGFWPRICIQAVTKKPAHITGFRVIADGRRFEIPAPSIRSEKLKDSTAQWYDAPLDQQAYQAVKALMKSRKAEVVYTSDGNPVSRAISDAEKQGLSRIMEAYTTLGGNMAFLGEPAKGTGNKR